MWTGDPGAPVRAAWSGSAARLLFAQFEASPQAHIVSTQRFEFAAKLLLHTHSLDFQVT
jgi:hypothetical protein